ncbi:trehalase family glycosidase [Bacteroides xylanisolvens]|nr:trehalase family glycosidase [Bacteroides xylanisolvens]
MANLKASIDIKMVPTLIRDLDGVSPLIANISSKEQTRRMINHVFSPDEMWTEVGISTVDRSAPYYRTDGYWNGAVWFPHQWMVWKALLDLGEGEKAHQVATTALNTWEKECKESYYTFEHFIISSQRGAGWHQFSGLSSPILNLVCCILPDRESFNRLRGMDF